jgi:predicted SAM-dependent methyltransferase
MINLDLRPFPGVDIVHDVSEHWPFLNQRFEEIHANHVLEHVHQLIFVMNEAWRCLRPAGKIYISVPWWSGTWARGDPTHVRQFDHNTFNYFSDWFERSKYLGIQGPWKKLAQDYDLEPPDADRNFLKKFGFSDILQMRLILEKP